MGLALGDQRSDVRPLRGRAAVMRGLAAAKLRLAWRGKALRRAYRHDPERLAEENMTTSPPSPGHCSHVFPLLPAHARTFALLHALIKGGDSASKGETCRLQVAIE